MSDCIKENYFDRSKVFYPYIMQYIITYHGAVELFSRGIIQDIKRIQTKYGIEKVIDYLDNVDIKDKSIEFLEKEHNLTPLLGKLSLYSSFMGKSIDINIEEIADEAVSNYNYLLEHLAKAAGMLIIMAFELTKQFDDKRELWNFFYHCRNAAAHGGKFKITNPRFPAKWGKLEITSLYNGTNLFFIPGKGGLLSIGDPIRLLWDVEQIYI